MYRQFINFMILRISPIITCLINPPYYCPDAVKLPTGLSTSVFWHFDRKVPTFRAWDWWNGGVLHFRTKNNISNHGSHFRSCLSWDFTRAKKIIHNDDKRNGMIAYNWCIYLFLNHKFPNRQRSHFHLKFFVKWCGGWFKKFFSRKKNFFSPLLCFTIIFTLSISIFVLYLYKSDLLFSFW